jgi:hypothetical protein
MAKTSVASILAPYHARLPDELKVKLDLYSNNNRFEDDTWLYDKMIKSKGYNNSDYTWHFTEIPDKYRENVKYYSINENRIQATTMSRRIGRLSVFFKYLENQCGKIDLQNVTNVTLDDFKSYLLRAKLKSAYKRDIWSDTYRYFVTMKGWPEQSKRIPLSNKNPWTTRNQGRRNDNKYIPEFVAEQLDRLFYNNNILPVTQLLLYWLLRLIPSRGGEVASMSLDCLKPVGDGRYVLTIPHFKQSAHAQPELRMVYLKGEGIIAYLISLINKQQLIAQKFSANDLFIAAKCQFRIDKRNNTEEYIIEKRIVSVSAAYITRFLKTYCKRYNIKDEDGKPYKVTSHQFRHNGISDRIDAGFTLLEIRDMTGHKGDAMPRWAYYHPSQGKLVEQQKKVIKTTKDKGVEVLPKVSFRGRILNIDDATERKLLANPRAYKLRNGICSDITSCKSGIFECLVCDYFIPKVEDLDYWEEMVKHWEEKVEISKRNGKADENAEYTLALHRKVTKHIYETLRNVEDHEYAEAKA